MLPDYDTCVARINSYIHKNYTSKGWGCNLPGGAPDSKPAGNAGFRDFWTYKTGVESKGVSILNDNNLPATASKLRQFLIAWKMGITGVAVDSQLQHILKNIRPYYDRIRSITLGSGVIHQFRSELEIIYQGLGGVTNNIDYTGSESSIVGKSKTLVAVWGQTPGFDSKNRKNFVKWTRPPTPLVLRHLRASEIWYEPTQFCDMILELDEWVSKWPASNSGMIFSQSFNQLCPNTPVGRLIDMIYN
jgi:hypothetical protein